MNAASDDQFVVRRARPDEAGTIAWHRARMFQDMGEIPDKLFKEFVAASRAWTEKALGNGEYVGWFAIPKAQSGLVVAGAGVQLRQVAPHPCRPSRDDAFGQGRHAIVLNVFTEPEWRNRGVARLLMDEVVRWARDERLDRLVLHASPQARSLYDQMGFVVTNEMRFDGDLSAPV